MGTEKYSVWVVDNDMQARMRLKTATSSVATFGQVKLLNTMDEAVKALENSNHVDIVFVARRFGQDVITQFVRKCKETQGGRDSAYVLVLKTDDQDSNTVAQNVLIGADGFLLEPYSVDNLVEIAQLAARVKRERSLEREQTALKFLVDDVIKQIDRVAFIKSCGFDVGRNLKKLKEMCQVFNDLQSESQEVYFEIAIEQFINAPLPPVPDKNYKGVSERVRKRMEAKLIEEMEAQAEADALARAQRSG